MNSDSRIYVAGHRGLVGNGIMRSLEARGFDNLITASSADVDLRDQVAVREFFAEHKPTHVFVAAAKVGGILANDTYPVDFLYDNLMIEANVIHSAFHSGVEKLLFLGSVCIYPKMAPQPIKEEYLLTGPLEPTNEWYAIAKIAGIKLCQAFRKQHGADFISAQPTNLYGIGDNFDLDTSHVLPALIRKVHEAKRDGRDAVTLWGTGTPRREFLYVDDCADACVELMLRYSTASPANIGSGQDISIHDLAMLVQRVIGYEGEIQWDTTKPDGTPRRLVDNRVLSELEWAPAVGLEEGIHRTYSWWRNQPPARAALVSS